ncbi:SCP family extracellular subfamily protein [Besnoitia besnoiti]|uniref:SCP family extracellular subfamily protein n=1 Tax=Besnoitia besnoiti TaxID=94643 RepID=A0A2A9MAH3_BESBE|nr:SCP family extracellular subfamily protein [Besnoitia besnoiti]PFH32382.1 SCP family extracellular subfamily protein [Besnoitia besnoiti]
MHFIWASFLREWEDTGEGRPPWVPPEVLCSNCLTGVTAGYPGTTWDLSIGHFTQVMWEKSTGLACARTTGCTGWNQLFCLYSPPGNYEGEAPFSEAVWKSIKKRDGLSGAMALAPVSTGALAVAAGALLHVLVA